MGFEFENTAILDTRQPQAVSSTLGFSTDINMGGAGPSQFGASGAFAETQSIYISHQGDSAKNTTVVAMILLVLSFGAYFLYKDGSLDSVLVTLGLSSPPAPVYVPAKRIAVIAPPQPPVPVVEQIPAAGQLPSIWTEVVNEVGVGKVTKGTPLTSDQMHLFNAQMSSRFNYQHYKAVTTMGINLPEGAAGLLHGTLKTERFWTRMRALIALVDLGVAIEPADVKTSLGDAHSELRARFFKRFEKSPCSVGCYYVARASLPFLDAQGRAQVLRVISGEPSVRETASEWLDRHDYSPKIWGELNHARGKRVAAVVPDAAAQGAIFDAQKAAELVKKEGALKIIYNQSRDSNVTH